MTLTVCERLSKSADSARSPLKNAGTLCGYRLFEYRKPLAFRRHAIHRVALALANRNHNNQ